MRVLIKYNFGQVYGNFVAQYGIIQQLSVNYKGEASQITLLVLRRL